MGDLIGWAGSVLLLANYGALAVGLLSGWRYHAVNGAASFVLVVYNASIGSVPMVVLNIAFMNLALAGILREITAERQRPAPVKVERRPCGR